MTFLLECSLRAAVIIMAALAVASLLRRASAATRHWILAASMLCAAVLPLIVAVVPEWTIPIYREPASPVAVPRMLTLTPEQNIESTAGVNLSITRALSNDAEDSSASVSASDKDGEPQSFFSLKSILQPGVIPRLYALWTAGTMLALFVLITGWIRLIYIAGKSNPVQREAWTSHADLIGREYGIRRKIHLLQSRCPAMLATWGFFRPKIVLPPGAEKWHEDRIQVVLRHELAHVRRQDCVVQVLSELLRAIYWFNPLIWVACSYLRREAEQACDDTVINSGIAGSDYAAHLLDLAKMLRSPRHAWSPALLMARDSTLEQRFEALLNPDLNRRTLTRLAIAATSILFVAITFTVAALRVSAQEVLSLDLPVNVSGAPLGLAAQLTRPALTRESESASIEGIVVRMDTGEPMPEVHVELNVPESRSNARVATTSGKGEFVFQNVPPGNYQLVAAHDGGYLPAVYGQRTVGGRGLTLELDSGQKLKGLRISMARPGSISGRVLDREGEPVGRAQVQALRTVYMDGQRSESIVASVATDDRGEYRLYWLPPGQYHVAATPQDVRRGWVPVIPKSLSSPGGFYTLLSTPDVMRRVVDGGQIQEEVQVAAYFPGTTSLEEASLIEVSGGANIAGMNIIVAPPKPVQRIRGILINAATGQPIRDGTVRVMPLTNSGNVMGLGMGKSDRDGRFEIHGLLPGSYVLTAMANSGGDRADLDGEVPVTVGANDLENISIPLSTGVDIPVSIRIEGSPVGAGVTFRLRSVPTQPFPGGSMFMRPGTPQWNLLNTRQFTIEGLRPGTYRFSFVPMGGGGPGATLPVYVKSITLGTADVLNGLLRIDGPVEQPLQMTLSANVSILEGVVLDQRQEPVPNVSVAVIPDAPYRGRADLYATGITDAGGRFRIGGIAPGNYRVFSWETVEGWSWLDPEWLRPYEGRGRSLHFEEGSRDNIQLTVIRD